MYGSFTSKNIEARFSIVLPQVGISCLLLLSLYIELQKSLNFHHLASNMVSKFCCGKTGIIKMVKKKDI